MCQPGRFPVRSSGARVGSILNLSRRRLPDSAEGTTTPTSTIKGRFQLLLRMLCIRLVEAGLMTAANVCSVPAVEMSRIGEKEAFFFVQLSAK